MQLNAHKRKRLRILGRRVIEVARHITAHSTKVETAFADAVQHGRVVSTRPSTKHSHFK
jgi:hypothetical protein